MKKQVEETPITVYPSEELTKIEESRKAFFPLYKKNDKIEKILFGVGILIIIFGWLIFPALVDTKVMPWKLFQVLLMLVPAVALIVYALVTKKVINNKAKNFFATYYNKSNEFVLNQEKISGVFAHEPANIDKVIFDKAKLFKGVEELRSKGYTEFNYNGLQVGVCDCAAITKKDKRLAVCFTGKFVHSATKYIENDPIIVYLKGDGILLPPTNVDDLEKVVDDENMTVYTSNKNWKTVLTGAVMKKVEAIRTNKLLVDLSISLVNGQLSVAMGYDDPLMVPPFEKEFNSKPIEQYKKDLANVLEVMEALK